MDLLFIYTFVFIFTAVVALLSHYIRFSLNNNCLINLYDSEANDRISLLFSRLLTIIHGALLLQNIGMAVGFYGWCTD